MQIVMLLPGQGSQRPGMGQDLYEAFPTARAVYQAVDDALDTALSTLSFDGPTEELTRTHNAQPALLAHSAAAWAVIQSEVAPYLCAAAGHSLGEFSAYHVAGMYTVTDAARIVRRRGTLMYEQGLAQPGAMAAIIGTLSVPVESICAQATVERGMVVPANFNSAEQVVISGDVAGVERAMELAKEAGAKRCLPLPVSGAFHSPLMAPAAAGLAEALSGATAQDPQIPVIANVNCRPVRDAGTAQDLLVQQLTAPVQWTGVVQRLASDYPEAVFVELGTGSVLSGLVRRIAPQLKTVTCGTVADVESLIQLVQQHD